jgi:beta-phosphoglucomutase-like phosphatase (HAD superfamily)
LSSIIATRKGHGAAAKANLLMQLKEDIAVRQACGARPNSGAVAALESLQRQGVPFAIATTGGKPRVEACIDTAGLRQFFPDSELIHSGASDFTPPRFKPDPAVYLRAVAGVGLEPAACIAVEDSGSGVASAANAGMGLIVGYVGASHIPTDAKESHARSLLSGAKSASGRGADVVISHFDDLVKLVTYFQGQSPSVTEPKVSIYTIPREAIPEPSGAVFWR